MKNISDEGNQEKLHEKLKKSNLIIDYFEKIFRSQNLMKILKISKSNEVNFFNPVY